MTIIFMGLLAVLALLIYAATRPGSFRYERAIQIEAPPEKIYPLIDHLAGWQAWSPYEAKDPGMKRNFSGSPSGVGAGYAWDGNKQVGAGRMEIVQASAPHRILMKLDFERPMTAHNQAEFTLTPQNAGTRVVWALTGPSPFVSKLMGIFMNFDKMVGADFEVGLQKLKALAEK